MRATEFPEPRYRCSRYDPDTSIEDDPALLKTTGIILVFTQNILVIGRAPRSDENSPLFSIEHYLRVVTASLISLMKQYPNASTFPFNCPVRHIVKHVRSLSETCCKNQCEDLQKICRCSAFVTGPGHLSQLCGNAFATV